ncbi:MAG: type I-E CRISPR-associated protein Cas6/Cse3/CasE [Holophaga sp.]|nr:type I-E CRISPR-associated protein Cas6/Cse3/CasE [Holophaga sp.]
MFLHRIHLNSQCREARRDLADAYQMHASLARAFSPPDTKCPEGEFLWRLETAFGPSDIPKLLVQSRSMPDWSRIGIPSWLAREPDPPVDLRERLKLDSLRPGQRYRFRLRANPSAMHDGKRTGLLDLVDQEAWIKRKGAEQHGFILPELASFDFADLAMPRVDVRVSQEQWLRCHQHSGNTIKVFSVLFDGVLSLTDPDRFRSALALGIGHGKALGLGLLSVVPMP